MALRAEHSIEIWTQGSETERKADNNNQENFILLQWNNAGSSFWAGPAAVAGCGLLTVVEMHFRAAW